MLGHKVYHQDVGRIIQPVTEFSEVDRTFISVSSFTCLHAMAMWTVISLSTKRDFTPEFTSVPPFKEMKY